MNDAIIAIDDLIPMWGIFSGEIVEAIGRNEIFSGSTLREHKDSTLFLIRGE
jgi:hypothetical protein